MAQDRGFGRKERCKGLVDQPGRRAGIRRRLMAAEFDQQAVKADRWKERPRSNRRGGESSTHLAPARPAAQP